MTTDEEILLLQGWPLTNRKTTRHRWRWDNYPIGRSDLSNMLNISQTSTANCDVNVSSRQHEIHFWVGFCHSLLMCSQSRKLAPPPIQKALLGTCAFWVRRSGGRRVRESAKSVELVRLFSVLHCPAAVLQPAVNILEKLCAITSRVNNVVSGCGACKQCHKVTFKNLCAINFFEIVKINNLTWLFSAFLNGKK